MRPSRRDVLAGLAALGSAAPSAATSARAATAAPVLRRGINLWPWFSLTREFPAPRTDYPWPPFQPQRPVPTRQDLDRLRQAGLDFVRIPVDPGPFLAGDAATQERLLDSLAAAAAACADAGLAVVVNLQANGATHHWTPERLYGSPDAAALPAYRSLAAAVARRLDPARAVLEPVNEPPQACGSAAWFEIQRGLLAAARAAAPDLTLVATGGCGSMVPGLEALDPATLADLVPLLFTFHFYEPYLFSHQGAPWMREPVYRALNAVPWPAAAGTLAGTLKAVRARMAADAATPAAAKAAAYAETERVLKVYFDAEPDRRFVDRYIGRIAAWAARHGVAPGQVLMGEFGALRSDARYVAADPASRARYIRDVRESAESAGFSWAMWNLFDGMGLVSDDVARIFDPAIAAALGLAVPAGWSLRPTL